MNLNRRGFLKLLAAFPAVTLIPNVAEVWASPIEILDNRAKEHIPIEPMGYGNIILEFPTFTLMGDSLSVTQPDYRFAPRGVFDRVDQAYRPPEINHGSFHAYLRGKDGANLHSLMQPDRGSSNPVSIKPVDVNVLFYEDRLYKKVGAFRGFYMTQIEAAMYEGGMLSTDISWVAERVEVFG